jgi:hypothetical protein
LLLIAKDEPNSSEGLPVSSGPLKAIWGPVRLSDGRSAFPSYQRLGVEVLQHQLRWERVASRRPQNARNPADPAYAWGADIDEAIARAGEIGAEVALLVTGTPGWANHGRDWHWAPADAADFGDFAAAASRRYPKVRIWMVWGEPNRPDRFRPAGRRAAPKYARLLDSAYAALHEADEDDVVVGGMTFAAGFPRPARFLRQILLPDGRPPRLDWYGHNPYSNSYPDLSEDPVPGGYRDLSDLDTLAREVHRHWSVTHRRPRLWLSEFTIQSDRPSRIFRRAVSRASQARWLTQGFKVARESGVVAGLGWFSLVDQLPETADSSHWGLLTTDGKPKASFHAYRRVPGGR